MFRKYIVAFVSKEKLCLFVPLCFKSKCETSLKIS